MRPKYLSKFRVMEPDLEKGVHVAGVSEVPGSKLHKFNIGYLFIHSLLNFGELN